MDWVIRPFHNVDARLVNLCQLNRPWVISEVVLHEIGFFNQTKKLAPKASDFSQEIINSQGIVTHSVYLKFNFVCFKVGISINDTAVGN